MADAREVLEMLREVAQLRISMLRDGITLHNEAKRSHYLEEYEKKLQAIERLIRRQNLKLIQGGKGTTLDSDPR